MMKTDSSLSHDDLACRDPVETVTDYLESAMPENERMRLEAHLTICPGCSDQRRADAGDDLHHRLTPGRERSGFRNAEAAERLRD